MDKVKGKKVGTANVKGRECDIMSIYGRLWVVDPVSRRTVTAKVYREIEDVEKDYEVTRCH